ncbi:hypothetical protein TWF730_008810 [Orbilia blumenaviensis]
MFANNVREELKGQNLSFTEIARLVGERWKVLPPEQKEEYEYRAGGMKDRYNQELSAYKKTDQFKEYSQYLLEFKSREAAKEAGEMPFNPTTDTSRKRPKLESLPSQGSTHSSLPGSSTTAGGQIPPSSSSSRTQQPQDAAGSPNYPPAASLAMSQYSAQHGRRESYHSPFTQPSTPASQMYPSGPPESVMTLPFRDSPGRSGHQQFYEPARPPLPPQHGGGHPEAFEQGLMQLPKINHQPHIQQVLSYSRGQPSPGDSPSQHPRRSGSVSDGDGRQVHAHNTLRALPPLRNPSPSQRGSSGYFPQRPTREMGGSGAGAGGGGSGAGYPGHGSTSSSPRGQLPSLSEQTMQEHARRGGDGTEHS